jgi:hypothetical protein
MTRTRAQTKLTNLAELVANMAGELAFLAFLAFLGGLVGTPEAQGAVSAPEARRVKLVSDREALYATPRQFDPTLSPEQIGAQEAWAKSYSRNTTKKYSTHT